MGETPTNTVPTHVGFCMDGNRRWAKAHKLEIARGHLAGSEALENIINECGKKGIGTITFFSFSTENWKRTDKEVETLMSLFLQKISEKESELTAMGARVKFIGRTNDFSGELQAAMHGLEEKTKANDKIMVNFAVSYGGKAEIVDAVKGALAGGVKPVDLTATDIDAHIYEAGQPDPELIIRTGGESRLSGFMLWQSTYSELYFTPTLWPDFNVVELEKALDWYADIKRNFGK